MRRAWLAGLLLLGVSAFQVSAAPLPTEAFGVSTLHPTQFEVGMASAQEFVRKWKEEAKKSGKSVYEIAVQSIEAKGLPAYIGPNGRAYIVDGHHRTTALTLLIEEARKTDPKFDVRVHVQVRGDFRGKAEEVFARAMIETDRQGYFPAALRKKSALERLKAFPDRILDLKDNPLRAALGEWFDRYNLDSSSMVEYVQFIIGERLESEGFKIDAKDPISNKQLERLSEALLERPEEVRFLSKTARNKADSAYVAIQIESALRGYAKELESESHDKRLKRVEAAMDSDLQKLLKIMKDLCD